MNLCGGDGSGYVKEDVNHGEGLFDKVIRQGMGILCQCLLEYWFHGGSTGRKERWLYGGFDRKIVICQ